MLLAIEDLEKGELRYDVQECKLRFLVLASRL